MEERPAPLRERIRDVPRRRAASAGAPWRRRCGRARSPSFTIARSTPPGSPNSPGRSPARPPDRRCAVARCRGPAAAAAPGSVTARAGRCGALVMSISQPTFGSTWRSNVPGSQSELAAFSFDWTCVRSRARPRPPASHQPLGWPSRGRTRTGGRPAPAPRPRHPRRRDAERSQLVGGPDPAPQQHRRRPVGAGRQHDRLGLDHAGPIGGVDDDAARPAALRSPPGRRAPPPAPSARGGPGPGRGRRTPRSTRPSAPVHRQQPGTAHGVGGVEVIQHGLAEPGPGVERGSRERSDLVRCEPARRNRLLGAHQQRLHRRPAPAGVTRRDRPPVVVGRRAAHDEAAVVRRAAADDTAGDVDAVAPVVRRRAVRCVEQVGGPARLRRAGRSPGRPRSGRPCGRRAP